MRKNNFISYIKGSFGASEQFCEEMDLQLKPQFENLLGKQLNWEIIWIYIGNSDEGSFYIKKNNQDGIRIYPHVAMLMFGCYKIECVIYWYSLQKDKIFGYSEKNCKGKLRFVVESVNMKNKNVSYLPGSDQKIPLTRLDIASYFPVLIYGVNISMDGHFYVKLNDEKEINSVEKCLDEAIDQWNEDDGEVGGYSLNERGLFHNLYLTEEKDDGYFVFGYDSGYAGEEVFSYLIKSLSERTKSIIEFIIVSEGC